MDDRRVMVVAATIGTTQTVAWASSYYLPAMLADRMSGDLNVPRDWFFGAFSAALLVSAMLGPAVGRYIDRLGGRRMLAASNAVFAVALLIMASVRGPVGLVAAWSAMGLGMAMGLYEAAFATVAGLCGGKARRAITGVTIISGFASTIGWSGTAFLSDEIGWRLACVFWAALHGLACLPANWFLLPGKIGAAPSSGQDRAPDHRHSRGALAVLAVTFAAAAFIASAMASHLPRLLVAIGTSSAGALAVAALVGPAQVGSRLLEFILFRRISALASAQIAVSLHPIAAIALAIFGVPAGLAFSILHGAGNGLVTIARGTLPLELFGPAGYGLRTGWLAMFSRLTQAIAPFVYGLVLDLAGPNYALALSTMLSLLCLSGFIGLAHYNRAQINGA